MITGIFFLFFLNKVLCNFSLVNALWILAVHLLSLKTHKKQLLCWVRLEYQIPLCLM